MGKFGKQLQSQPDAKTAPPAPPFCQCSGCNNDTAVQFMRVYNKSTAKTEIGGFGGHTGKKSYGYVNNGTIIMNEQFDFIGWVTRCGDCYQLELKGFGGRAKDICRKQFELMA